MTVTFSTIHTCVYVLNNLGFLKICIYDCVGKVRSNWGRPRYLFDDNKLLVIQQSFANDSYPTKNKIRSLSDALGLSTIQVQRWFTKARAKLRKGDIGFVLILTKVKFSCCMIRSCNKQGRGKKN